MLPETRADFLRLVSTIGNVDRARAYVAFEYEGKRPKEWIEAAKAAYPPGIGLGDIVASVATPIARALGLPCIDPKTQELRPESPCQEAKNGLNKVRI